MVVERRVFFIGVGLGRGVGVGGGISFYLSSRGFEIFHCLWVLRGIRDIPSFKFGIRDIPSFILGVRDTQYYLEGFEIPILQFLPHVIWEGGEGLEMTVSCSMLLLGWIGARGERHHHARSVSGIGRSAASPHQSSAWSCGLQDRQDCPDSQFS